MIEIEPCFYCGSECRVTPSYFSQASCFIRCIKSFCYSGKPYDEENEAIEQHNFIAKAVREAKIKFNDKEVSSFWVISDEGESYFFDKNKWEKEKGKTMKSIFDMTDEELKELHDPIILPGFGIRQGKLTPTVQYIKLQEPNTSESFSINIEMDSNQYKALKSIIDHEISYLEQKEKEAKEFKVGWVYKDGEGNEILIVSINPRFFPYGVLGFWLSSHWCRFSTYTLEGFSSGVPELESSKSLILSTGKKWGPIE